jgi:hypothetical protein
MVRVLSVNVVEYEGISTSATFHCSYLISGMLTFILITLFFFFAKEQHPLSFNIESKIFFNFSLKFSVALKTVRNEYVQE